MYHLTLNLIMLRSPEVLYWIYIRVYRITYVIVLIAEPFEETEEKWLSSLENTRWLEYVRFVQLLSFSPNSLFWNNYIFAGGAKILQSRALLTCFPVVTAHTMGDGFGAEELTAVWAGSCSALIDRCSGVLLCGLITFIDPRDHQQSGCRPPHHYISLLPPLEGCAPPPLQVHPCAHSSLLRLCSWVISRRSCKLAKVNEFPWCRNQTIHINTEETQKGYRDYQWVWWEISFAWLQVL